MRRPAVAAGAVLACLLFAACSSSSPSESSTSTTATRPTIAGTTTIPFNQALNARTDVAITGCTQTDGAWKATGTIKNSKQVARSYEIVVDFEKLHGDTVLDTKIVNVPDVGPGASTDWSTTGAAGDTEMNCVIRNAQARPA